MGAWEWIPEVWTWLYIISQDIWILVLLWAMYKYGDLKLGKDTDEPEFSTATWFSMLFCAGVAVGLTFYGVAEPVWHYKGSASYFVGSTDDEKGTLALVVTLYHWGLHGWIPYTLMGAVIAIMTFRRGYPMTIRYCFTPLIGDRVYGWMGDVVDIMSVVTTIAGVCTSLGLGAMQINSGLQRVNHGFYRGINYGIPDDIKYSNPICGVGSNGPCMEVLDPATGINITQESYGIQQTVGTQIAIIVVVTAMACLSVVLGLGAGIKFVSQFVFALGNFMLLLVLFSGETYFCLDAMVQSIGYYIWYILRIGFHCDAFERLGDFSMGLGGSPSAVRGSAGWMTGWTLFYWGWWISWGPFVGTFIARISKGRTLRMFIASTLLVPTLYSCVWFSILGGEGVRMQRMADASGLTSATADKCSVPDGAPAGAQPATNCQLYSGAFSNDTKKALGMGWNPPCKLDPTYHGGYGRCQQFAWTRYINIRGDSKCVKHTSWISVPCGGAEDPTFGNWTALQEQALEGETSPCLDSTWEASMFDVTNDERQWNHFPEADQPDCFVPLQDGIVNHYGNGAEPMPYDQLSSYFPRGIAAVMEVVLIFVLVLYFVTSSDSGSLVVDFITANGHPDPPMAQRVLWSWVEGFTAIALLYSGVNSPSQNASLKALQAASIIAGLPYTFILFWCAQALYLLVLEEVNVIKADRKAFNVFIFNAKLADKHGINTAVPGLQLGKMVGMLGKWPFAGFGEQRVTIIWMVLFSVLYYAAIIMQFIGIVEYSWHIIGLTLWIGYGLLVGLVRNGVRLRYSIKHGDLVTDILCGIFAPMFTISQMQEQIANDAYKKEDPEPSPAALPNSSDEKPVEESL